MKDTSMRNALLRLPEIPKVCGKGGSMEGENLVLSKKENVVPDLWNLRIFSERKIPGLIGVLYAAASVVMGRILGHEI